MFYSQAVTARVLASRISRGRAVERILELRNGGMSYHDIAAVMQAEGFETPQGGSWSRGGVHYLVKKHAA